MVGRQKVIGKLLCVGLLLGAWVLTQAETMGAANLTSWNYLKRININTTVTGADVTDSSVQNFPLLVRLSSADFDFSLAQADGSDLRFESSAGVIIPHEIEHWDAAAGQAAVWVKVPYIERNSADAFIRMYWGNVSTTSTSNGAQVFGSANGYRGVWHLGDPALAQRSDASSNGRHGIPEGFDGDERIPGIIGWADSLDAQNDRINLGDIDLDDGQWTLSAWVRMGNMATYGRIIIKNHSDTADPWYSYGLTLGEDGVTPRTVAGNSKLPYSALAKAPLVKGQWYHLAAVYQNERLMIFVNGSLVTTSNRFAGPLLSNDLPTYIGWSPLQPEKKFIGAIDEVRISDQARSRAWIKLNYMNQRPDQKLYTFGETIFRGCAPVFEVSADTTVGEGETVNIRATVDCAEAYGWITLSPEAPLTPPGNAKVFTFKAPRVSKDTKLEYLFSAYFTSNDSRTHTVGVTVKNTIPEPNFTLTLPNSWNGRDSLSIQPVISNLAAVQGSQAPSIRYAWKLAGIAVDTVHQAERLVLLKASGTGVLEVTLCLDNSGPQVCLESPLYVDATTGVEKSRSPVNVAMAKLHGNRLEFSRQSRFRVLTPDGKTLLSGKAAAGGHVELPPEQAERLRRGAARLAIDEGR